MVWIDSRKEEEQTNNLCCGCCFSKRFSRKRNNGTERFARFDVDRNGKNVDEGWVIRNSTRSTKIATARRNHPKLPPITIVHKSFLNFFILHFLTTIPFLGIVPEHRYPTPNQNKTYIDCCGTKRCCSLQKFEENVGRFG